MTTFTFTKANETVTAPQMKSLNSNNDRRPAGGLTSNSADAQAIRDLKNEIHNAVQAEINSAFGLAKAFANAIEHHYSREEQGHYPIEAIQFFHQLLVVNNRPRLANRIKELATKMTMVKIGNKDGKDTYSTFKPKDDNAEKMPAGKTAKTADEKRLARRELAIKWLEAFYSGEINALTEQCPAIGEIKAAKKTVTESATTKLKKELDKVAKLLEIMKKEEDINVAELAVIQATLESQLSTVKTMIPNPMEGASQEEIDREAVEAEAAAESAEVDSNALNHE